MKRTLLLAALGAASLLGWAQTRPAAAPVKKPKLVVMIVVDQFRYDYLTKFGSQFTGGFRRLLDRGAVFTNAYYNHMPTVTAVGHSIVLSGAMPASSGIVGNEWYDRQTGQQVTSVSDENVKQLGAPAKRGASPHRLLISTVGDELKMSGKAPSKVVSLSIKDRSAIMPGGHMADGAYWFDKPTGNFVSSTWYFQDLPAWVKTFNEKKAIDKFKGTLGYDKMAESSPGNDVVELFAETAIEGENLGRNAGIDLLSMSFSANDTVGHAKGPDSPEAKEITLHTDKVLARFFDFLDKRIGLSNVIVVLSADHGVSPLPELMASRKMPGGRMTEGVVINAVTSALNAKYGEAKWVLGKSGPSPYLDHKLIADSKLDLEEVQQTAAQAVRNLPHIARVFTREELRRGLAQNDMVGRRVQNGFFYQRASDLVIVPEPYWLFEKSGTSHGTPWNYDAHVPVIFMGPGIKPGKYNEAAAVNDIAPTLTTILEVETPSGSAGRVLTEMLVK
ncbi:alkaline phosphatase family protein [uncultured Paludibaculum sp.]|uniref:alkaline phosphatase family protein n=1 Tax=uncultured Paludibaculum sp. TaxID=1765020 RepID=UPI002AAAB945|nr:alkaline phosphatase family protein [uncultured Paludibaculum sp.]